MKIRWKFGELKWNHSNVRAPTTNKQTDTETDADEISTASLRGGNNLLKIIKRVRSLCQIETNLN